MKRMVCFFIVLCGVAGAAFSQTATEQEQEYHYPQWVMDLRRTEVVTFGTIPFTWLIATTVVDLYRSSQQNWDARYLPWPAKSAGGVPMTNDEYLLCIGLTAGLSITCALVDLIIINVKRYKTEMRNAQLPKGETIIKRRPLINGVPGEEEIDDSANSDSGAAPGGNSSANNAPDANSASGANSGTADQNTGNTGAAQGAP
jgi:hypothetical protein